MSRAWFLALGLLLAPLTALLLAPAWAPSAEAAAAPDFTLRDINNQVHTLSQYKGKVVLVNFWATWCVPCQVEMPHLQKLHQDLGGKGLVVLGISTDDARSSSQVKPLVMSKGISYPVLLDKSSQVVALFNPAKTLPYSVVIGKTGEIAYVHPSYTAGDEAILRAKVEAELAK